MALTDAVDFLNHQLDTLNEEKSKRLERLEKLKQEDILVCQQLQTIPFFVASGTVPSLTMLKDMEEHIKLLEKQLVKKCREEIAKHTYT